jgi:hypothetical protein
VLDIAVRAGNRTKRELLERVGPLRDFADRRHQARLVAHQPFLPALTPGRGSLVETLREGGACVSSLDELGFPGTEELKAGLVSLKTALAQRPRPTQDTVRPPLSEVLADARVWQWGLDEALLDMVESYLGLPARYYGADVRLEQATARAVGVRQWHRDVEDHRMFKVLVWLNDVDIDGGPFEYVSRRHTPRLVSDLGYVTGFVDDEDLEGLVPRPEWRQATGPMWTAVLADTRAIFHRAKPPVAHDRYSVTFSYTSRTPTTTLPTPRLSPEHRDLARHGLSDRQLACLPRAFAL